MAIQPQIAMGFQMPQFQLPNQGNMLMQVAQLQQMQEANALRQAQARKLQLDEEQENALARLMQSGGEGVTLPQFVGAGGFTRGTRAFELSQAQRGAQQKETAGRQLTTAQTLAALRGDLSDEALGYASQMLAQQGQRDPFIAELMLTPREDRQLLASRLMNAVPGMDAARLATQKAELGIGETEAKIAKTQSLTDVERARLAGTLPRGEQQRLAPSIQTIADPTDPSQQLLVDATTYRGGGLGSPGVLGRPGITREPAPVLTTIQDPNDPTRTIVVNARAFQGQRDGAGTPGVVGVAGAQATVSREDVKKELAQTQLNDTLDAISGMYAELNRLGGIASTERSAFANVPARIAGSAVGQIAGQAIGTSEQSLRDRIAAARFTLVQQIKNATGMSARQMDSNVELQNTLNSLSDPRQGYEAAINIIENLRKTYGLGGGAPTGEPASRGAAGGPAAAPAQPASGAPIRLPKDNADAVYNSLPSGAQFIDPNGVLRRKP
jgi:hypothetical protein